MRNDRRIICKTFRNAHQDKILCCAYNSAMLSRLQGSVYSKVLAQYGNSDTKGRPRMARSMAQSRLFETVFGTNGRARFE